MSYPVMLLDMSMTFCVECVCGTVVYIQSFSRDGMHIDLTVERHTCTLDFVEKEPT